MAKITFIIEDDETIPNAVKLGIAQEGFDPNDAEKPPTGAMLAAYTMLQAYHAGSRAPVVLQEFPDVDKVPVPVASIVADIEPRG